MPGDSQDIFSEAVNDHSVSYTLLSYYIDMIINFIRLYIHF